MFDTRRQAAIDKTIKLTVIDDQKQISQHIQRYAYKGYLENHYSFNFHNVLEAFSICTLSI